MTSCSTCKKHNTFSCPYRGVTGQLSCARYYEEDIKSSVDYFDHMRNVMYGPDWPVALMLIPSLL